jgi:hypothetical protein
MRVLRLVVGLDVNSKQENRIATGAASVDPSKLPFYAVMCLVFSILVFLSRGHGIDWFFLDRAQLDERFITLEGNSIELLAEALMRTPAYVAFYLYVYLFATKFWNRTGPWSIVLFLVLAPAFIIFNFPTSVPRLWLGSTIIAIALLIMKFRTGKANTLYFFGMLSAITIVFPLTDVLRNIFSQTAASLTLGEQIMAGYTQAHFDAFLMLLVIVEYVNVTGFGYGWNLISSVLFFVPRGIFPSKGRSLGAEAGEKFNFTFNNISSPFVSEIFYDFWYVGVMFGFFALGYLYCRLDKHWSSRNCGLFGLLLIPYAAGWQIVLMRGSTFTAYTYFLPITLLLYFAARFARRKIKQRPPFQPNFQRNQTMMQRQIPLPGRQHAN